MTKIIPNLVSQSVDYLEKSGNMNCYLYIKKLLPSLIFIITICSCKKDCLEKGKCSPSDYSSAYLQEQSTPSATGTVYYIDAQNGDKNNDGKSESEAFKTTEQLEGISFQPGDQILFKRNQYHFGEFQIESSGTLTQPIYIAAYGIGDMPIVKAGTKKDAITLFLRNANYITVQNLNIQGGAHAILLDGSNYITIEGCRIGEQSEAGIRATGRYTNSTGSNYGIVRYCLIYSGLSGNLGDLKGTDGIQLMDGASGWHIYSNEFKAWAHSAMSIKPLYSNLNSNDNIIENNLFECGDIDYMRALDIAGPEGRASNNLFRNNTIRNQSVTSHVHGNGNTVAYNLFVGLNDTEESTQPWAIDMHIFNGNSGGVDRTEYVCHHNKIYNNLFYNYTIGTGAMIMTSNNGTTYALHDNELINNIFYNCGTAIQIDEEPTAITVKNNLFYSAAGNASFIYHGSATTLSEFELYSGNNNHTFLNNIEANPSFINSALGDFHLQLGSPAIDAGVNVGLASDFAGNLVTGITEIGPFQY